MVSLLEQIEKNTRVIGVKQEELTADSASKNQPTGSVWRDGKWVSK